MAKGLYFVLKYFFFTFTTHRLATLVYNDTDDSVHSITL
jgi:hypothetical protein